jgi:hypothetical protein
MSRTAVVPVTVRAEKQPGQLRLLKWPHSISVLPRSGIENRAGLKNLVQNLVQLRADEAPISPLGSSLLR